MRVGERWFLGSADAVFQNLNILRDERPEHVFVFGADHIYRMDPSQMLEQHVDTKAGVTVADGIVAVYPRTLYRWWHYGKLPESACLKVGNTLFFDERELKRFAGVRQQGNTCGT